MTERTGIPAIDDAAYLRDVLDAALRASVTGRQDGYTHALIPDDVADEIVEVQKMSAWIPFAREIPGEWREPTRWERIRWRIAGARYAVRRWIHGLLFPEEERALRIYEDEPR